MKSLLISAMLVIGASSAMVCAAEESGTYVKDSIITTKVKTKLAAKHMSTLAHVKVDTDANGSVWLSGRAPTKDAADLAEQITKDTDGVTAVHNNITVATK